MRGLPHRRSILLFGVLVLVGALAVPAYASHTGESTVTATVTPGVVSVSVSPTSVDYGTVVLGATDAVPTPPTFDATNNGTVLEDFDIRGANTTDWTLVSTAPGTDQYRHEASPDAFTTTLVLTTSNQPLAGNVAASGVVTVSLRLDAPSDSSVTTQQSAQVTVVATAA